MFGPSNGDVIQHATNLYLSLMRIQVTWAVGSLLLLILFGYMLDREFRRVRALIEANRALLERLEAAASLPTTEG